MTASVARFIESFIPWKLQSFSWTLIVLKRPLQGMLPSQVKPLITISPFTKKDLTISSVLLDNESLNFQMDDANEAFHIELPETGVLTLVIEFSGRITDNMTGIYPSYYTYNGEKKEIISTQFESHFAREAFPSVDEPEAKATLISHWNLMLKKAISLCQTCLKSIAICVKKLGFRTFETTPRMSTYLLALVWSSSR